MKNKTGLQKKTEVEGPKNLSKVEKLKKFKELKATYGKKKS